MAKQKQVKPYENKDWGIKAYSQESIVEGTIQKGKYYYLTFYRLATGLPGNIWNYAYEHNISLEPSAVIKTSANEFLYCYRLD